MAYLTTGKRTQMEQQYTAECVRWARAAGVQPPLVRVRRRAGGSYRPFLHLITMPPAASKDSLVHEFAHHLDNVLFKGRFHGRSFRVALVQATTLAYGDPRAYNWAGEYSLIARWAQQHGLCSKV